jgi:hypothetical protein
MQTFQVHLSKSISHLPWSCHWLRHHSCRLQEHINDCHYASAQDQGRGINNVFSMCSYLAACIVHYTELAMPLTQLTHHDVKFSWTADSQQSFKLLEKIIASDPVQIISDPNKPSIIACDASNHSDFAVLIQADDDGLRHRVAFRSRKWTSSELKWPTRDKECRAVLDAISHWSTWV